MKKTDLVIIGAGASGMCAAVYAARNGCRPVILEAQDRIGKKILATGNGKCNYTNRKMDISCYRSNDLKLVRRVIESYDYNTLIEFMESIGIWPMDKAGYTYPNSGQALSVVKAFTYELQHLGAEVYTEMPVKKISCSNGFTITAGDGKLFRTDKLILSGGSYAGIKKRDWPDGMKLSEQIGFKCEEPVPALTALHCAGKFMKQWAGVRCEAEVLLCVDDTLAARDRGEVQLTDYGISGIPVFQISSIAARGLRSHRKVKVYIDFMPQLKEEELYAELSKRQSLFGQRGALGLMNGLFNEKLSAVFLNKSFIKEDMVLHEKDIRKLAGLIKSFCVEITDTNKLEQSQVCAGGVHLSQINIDTMESKRYPGLYLTGELLDADGICGGYNLHWAFATGAIAGKSAARNKV